MSTNVAFSRRVSLRLTRNASGKNTISRRETMHRTKEMIAYDRGLTGNPQRLISTGDSLSGKWLYSETDKKNLDERIEDDFFSDVKAKANRKELADIDLVDELITLIFEMFIPEAHRDE